MIERLFKVLCLPLHLTLLIIILIVIGSSCILLCPISYVVCNDAMKGLNWMFRVFEWNLDKLKPL